MTEKKKILYVANVQYEKIVNERGIKRNYSIAGNTKLLAIGNALLSSGHKIVIYSPGSVAEKSGKFFFSNQESVCVSSGTIEIFYGITVDNRYLRSLIEWISMLIWLPRLLKRYDINTIFIYNISMVTVSIAIISKILKKQIFIEYEDSAVVSRSSSPPWWKKIYRLHEIVLSKMVSGAFAPSLDLLKRLGVANCLHLPGALNEDLIMQSMQHKRAILVCDRPLRLIYAGGLDASKGIDLFLEAIEYIKTPLEIHICGRGPLEKKIVKLSLKSRHRVVFHGLVEREELISLMVQVDVGVNPHRSDLHEGGTWPFKVMEYLAACGTVFCNNSARMPTEFNKMLFLYHADKPVEITKAFEEFLTAWPELCKTSSLRRKWAISEFGLQGLATKLNSLLDGNCRENGLN